MNICLLRCVAALIVLAGCADDGISKRAEESCAVICDCVVDSAGPSAARDCHRQCTSAIDEESTVNDCEDALRELDFAECRSSCAVLAQESGSEERDSGTSRPMSGSSPDASDAGAASCSDAVDTFRACASLLRTAVPSSTALFECCRDSSCGARSVVACVSARVTKPSMDSCQRAFAACIPDAGR